MSLFVDCDSREELDAAFAVLADGGQVFMPLCVVRPFVEDAAGKVVRVSPDTRDSLGRQTKA